MPVPQTSASPEQAPSPTVIERFAGQLPVPADPKLAVVISCYNYEGFIARAVRSVLDQGRDDCEIVVVDDGSTDGSWGVIKSLGVSALRINNSGQPRACLLAADETKAPFILFLDADDELMPQSLAIIIGRLDAQVAKLQFSLQNIDEHGQELGDSSPLEAFRQREALARRVLRTGVYRTPPTSGNVFRRDLCEYARGGRYDNAIDGVMLFVAPFVGDVVSLSQTLGRYRIHQRNLSGLGRDPEPLIFERTIRRFVARMDHLRTILGAEGRKLAVPSKVYYFRELRFCLAIASGKRPQLKDLLGLLAALAGEPSSLKTRAGMATFFVLGSVLPRARAKSLLAYRFWSGSRSMRGFIARIFETPARTPA